MKLVPLDETLDKIAALRAADQAGRIFTLDGSVELAKFAGFVMAQMAKEAGPIGLASTVAAKAVRPSMVLKSLGTQMPAAAAKATGAMTSARQLLGTAPTMGVGQAIKAPTSMGDVAQRMMKTPAPVGSVTPGPKALEGSRTALEGLKGANPTQLPGTRPTGTNTMFGRMQHTPYQAALEGAKPNTKMIEEAKALRSAHQTPVGKVSPNANNVTGAGTPAGKARQAATPKPAGGVQQGPAAAQEIHPAQKAGRDNYRSDPSAQAEVRSNYKARGVPDAEIAKYHNAMMGEGYAPVAVPKSGPMGTPQPKAPAVGGASPSGYHPMPGAMPVSPQGAAAAHVAPGPAAGGAAYTPNPAAVPAAQPYGTGAQVGGGAPPAAPGAPPAGGTPPGGVQAGPAAQAPAGKRPKGPGKVTKMENYAASPQAQDRYHQLQQQQLSGREFSKGDQNFVKAYEGVGKNRQVSERAQELAKKHKRPMSSEDIVKYRQQAEGELSGKTKGVGMGKMLGLGAAGLAAYGGYKGLQFAGRQMEQGGGGSMAYGGGWSPVPYGYGSTPYGPGGGGATI